MPIRLATELDLDILAAWFQSEHEAKTWGGPGIRYPILSQQLKDDIQWHNSRCYVLTHQTEQVVGFAQVSKRYGYQHLGRIGISPAMRGQSLGYQFLMELLDTVEAANGFSLFVYADNVPARKLYEKLGFVVSEYPREQAEIEGCLFMVR